MDDKITYEDVKEYEGLFVMAPSFILEMFARRNTNLVSKFKSQIQYYFNNLDETQLAKLWIILNSDVDELQAVMGEAYRRRGLKQYEILANPKYSGFIEDNLNELKKII